MTWRNFLTTTEASHYLLEEFGIRRAVRTLNKERVVKAERPIAFRKVGRQVLYARTDLDAWAKEMLGLQPVKVGEDIVPAV